VVVFAILAVLTTGSITRQQEALPALFPAPEAGSDTEQRPSA
jgi:hypothetical protein